MLHYNYPNIRLTEKDLLEIHAIVASGWVCSGKWVKALEDFFVQKCKTKYAIACASATSGLIISVKAANWKNKAIALPSFTWQSTLYAIECNGNTPVFCDIKSKQDWTIDISNSEKSFDGIIPVDTFGADSSSNLPRNIPCIYDAAHGFDLANLGQRGAIAEIVSLSFTKLVTGMQGGIILCQDDAFYKQAKELVMLSAKLEEINAFIALQSIRSYAQNLLLRREIIQKYNTKIHFGELVQRMPHIENPSVYAVLLQNKTLRDEVKKRLGDAGYETKVYYEPLVAGLDHTDSVFSSILALPVHDKMKENQDEIIHIINSLLE